MGEISRPRLRREDFISTGEFRAPRVGEFYRFGHSIQEATPAKVSVKSGIRREIMRPKPKRGVKITERIEIEIDGRILTDDEVQTLRDALAA